MLMNHWILKMRWLEHLEEESRGLQHTKKRTTIYFVYTVSEPLLLLYCAVPEPETSSSGV